MNAEQWLADLETKADAATQGTWKDDGGLMSPSAIFAGDTCIAQFLADNDAEYLVAANPATVKRLVAMVWAGAFNAARSKGLFTEPEYWLETAYQQTEPK